ncbi:MAG: ABC transporter permease [Microbacteriaceae bacterium]|nr:ABC transporter permease [Burkholderiaceae bacterium]
MLTASRLRVIRRRLLQALPVLVLATFVVFGLLKLMPGDIAITLAGENATDQRIAEIRALYGLDRPFLVQYGSWLVHAAQGDLSKSLASGEPVAQSIARAFPNTLLIVALAMTVALGLGIPLGMLAASRPDGLRDRVVTSVASLGIAVPSFWLAMILVAWAALDFGWFPATGAVPLKESVPRALHHAVLPALALAAGGVAEVSRQLRSSLVEILASPPVRTLRAKGLSAGVILWKHGLKNAGVNLLTVATLLFNRMLAATVVVEAVFAIPGMGNLIVNAALTRDLPVVQGVVFVMVLVVITVNLVADLLYTVLDPRIS